MLRFKKILLSLSLCLILLTGSVFATTMPQSYIISEFNEFSSTFDTFDDSDFSMSVSDQVNDLLSYYDISPTNYIYYSYYDTNYFRRYICYYDLGNNTIDSFSYSGNNGTFFLTGNIDFYTCYCYEDDSSANSYNTRSLSSIFVTNVFDDGESDPYYYEFLGSTFNTIFTYSSNNIFTESGGSGGLFDNIMAIMTSILAFIVPVATGLLAIPLFKFVIYASVALGIIYFVIKLVRRFVPGFGPEYGVWHYGDYDVKFGKKGYIKYHN